MRKIPIIVLLFLMLVPLELVWANMDVKDSTEELIIIPAGTVVELELSTPVHSKKNRIGDILILKVREDVVVEEVPVIQKGSTALAYVIDIKRAGPWGKGGGIKIKAECTWSVNDIKVPITFNFEEKGDRHKMLTPVGLFGLYAGYITGEHVVIPSGTRFTAKVAEES